MERGFNNSWTVATLLTIIFVCVFITIERELTPPSTAFEFRVFEFSYQMTDAEYDLIE